VIDFARLGNPVTLLVGSVDTTVSGIGYGSQLERAIDAKFHYYILANGQPSLTYSGQDQKVCLMRQNAHVGHQIATGLVPRLCELLNQHGVRYELVWAIPAWTRDPELALLAQGAIIPVEPHQSAAVASLLRQNPYSGRRGGIICGGTGAGKTRIAAKFIQLMQVRAVFFVNQTDLMRQAHAEISAALGCTVGMVGDGKCDIQPITIAMVQTVATATASEFETAEAALRAMDIRAMMEQAGVVVFDECHGVAADTPQAVLTLAINACAVVGLSASPWRDDGLDMLIEAACGTTVYTISATQLIAAGWLVQPLIFVHRLPAPRALTKDHLDTENYHKFYDAWVVNDAERNKLIAHLALQDIINGHVVLILVRRVPHGKILQEMIPHSIFLDGKVSSVKRKKILDDVRNGETLCLIATSLADQGLDIPAASSLILAGGGKSSTKALQRIGRVLRRSPGKTIAMVHDLVDKNKTLCDQFYQRMSIYRTEAAFEQNLTQMTVDYADIA
jgi:superfamily II DNA or RNA helicase